MNKSQSIFVQRLQLTLVICAGLCVTPALPVPKQNTQTLVAIEAVILATPPSGGSVATTINATIQMQFSAVITNPFNGTWTLNRGSNNQNYGNLTITANVPYRQLQNGRNIYRHGNVMVSRIRPIFLTSQ